MSAAAGVGYREIAAAIDYLVAHYQDKPSLAEAAMLAGVSPGHFQRLFSRWSGTSAQRFVQSLGLSDTGRVLLDGRDRLAAGEPPDLCCQTMTTAEYQAAGAGLEVRWGLHPSPFGPVLAAATPQGLCWLGFITDNTTAALARLAKSWSLARLIEDDEATQPAIERAFGWAEAGAGRPRPLSLLLRGSAFQIRVWQALLRIPTGALVSYQDVAAAIGQPKAVRAVGGAVGANPISILIPCHRVILKTGALHNYGWGPERKRALLAWELAQSTPAQSPSTSAMP